MIDRHNDWLISAYVTPSADRLLLMHDVKNDEAIRVFFLEAYELYLKGLLNPFYEKGTSITSKVFDSKLRALVKKYLDK